MARELAAEVLMVTATQLKLPMAMVFQFVTVKAAILVELMQPGFEAY